MHRTSTGKVQLEYAKRIAEMIFADMEILFHIFSLQIVLKALVKCYSHQDEKIRYFRHLQALETHTNNFNNLFGSSSSRSILNFPQNVYFNNASSSFTPTVSSNNTTAVLLSTKDKLFI